MAEEFPRALRAVLSALLLSGSAALADPDPGASGLAAPETVPIAETDTVPADAGGEGGSEETGEEEEGGDEESAAGPFWMETYSEGAFSRHEDRNVSGFTEFKLGRSYRGALTVEPYLKTRLYRDRRDFFWNNRADGGAGLRIPLLKKVSLKIFGEVITGQYLRVSSGALALGGLQARVNSDRDAIEAAQREFQAMYQRIFQAELQKNPTIDRNAIRYLDSAGNIHMKTLADLAAGQGARLDSLENALEASRDSLQQAMDSVALVPAGGLTEYRAGLVFWHGWGEGGGEAVRFGFPFRFWGEVYSDGIFSSLSRKVRTRGGGEAYRDSMAHFRNFIFYANPHVGAVVMEGPAGNLYAYGTVYAWFDTHKDWWNNLALAGPGLRYKPIVGVDLAFKAEYLVGGYYGREREEDPNPYDREYRDLRLSGSFWYGLGI